MSQKEKNKTPPELDDQLEEAAAKEAAEEPLQDVESIFKE